LYCFHDPALADLHELSVANRPFAGSFARQQFDDNLSLITQRRNVRTPQGSTCGIELTAERLSTPALHIQTPLPGLLLAGAGHLRPRCAGGVLGWLAGGDKRRFGAACPVEGPKRRVRPRLQ